jgi:hypothetical protein
MLAEQPLLRCISPGWPHYDPSDLNLLSREPGLKAFWFLDGVLHCEKKGKRKVFLSFCSDA